MITAFDPGPHVGVAQWDNGEHGEWEMDRIEFFTNVERIVQASETVVCESFFILGSRDANSNQTIELIGILRWLCWRHNKPMFLQPPADAKLFSTNEKLKKLGWYKPAKNDHARSASRHLLLYLVNTRQIDVSRFL